MIYSQLASVFRVRGSENSDKDNAQVTESNLLELAANAVWLPKPAVARFEPLSKACRPAKRRATCGVIGLAIGDDATLDASFVWARRRPGIVAGGI